MNTSYLQVHWTVIFLSKNMSVNFSPVKDDGQLIRSNASKVQVVYLLYDNNRYWPLHSSYCWS